jgi:tRNA U38,U39,U40 pseudouridine synthase TruA
LFETGFCQLKERKEREFNDQWLSDVNSHLPSSMRVVGVTKLPEAAVEFHAEGSCTQRVYEYMIPLSLLMTAPDADGAPGIIAELTARGVAAAEEQFTVMDNRFYACAAAEGEAAAEAGAGAPRQKKTKWWSTKRPDVDMDALFPISSAEASVRRVDFFRNLKVLLKRYGGNHHFHNFATGGASPDEPTTVRKVARAYHKELIRLRSGDAAALPDSLPRVPEASSEYADVWAVFSVSGDSFVRGQVS